MFLTIFRQDNAVGISGASLGSVFLASLLGALSASVLTWLYSMLLARIAELVTPGLTKLDEVVIPYAGVENVHQFGDYDDYEEYGDYGAELKLRK